MHDESYLEALAKQLRVTPEELRSSGFWREIGGEDLDAVQKALQEESEWSSEYLA